MSNGISTPLRSGQLVSGLPLYLRYNQKIAYEVELVPKEIPKIVSDELHFPVSYAIVRGMDSRRAVRNVTNDKKAQVWIKVIHDIEELGTQLHIHLRLVGCDFWATGEPETIDVDFYINEEDLPENILTALNYRKDHLKEL